MGEEEGQGVLGEEEGAFAGNASKSASLVIGGVSFQKIIILERDALMGRYTYTLTSYPRPNSSAVSSRRPRTRVEDCCRNRRPAVDLFDLRKSALHALFATDVRGNPDGFAARRVDLVGEAVEVGGVSGQEDDGVGLCETACEGGACA